MVHEHKIVIETRTFIRFWAVIAAIAGLVGFLYLTRDAWYIIIISMFLAIALNPIVGFLIKKMPGRSRGNRTLAAALAYTVVIAILGVAIALIVPIVWREGSNLLRQLPGMVESATGSWGGLDGFLENQGLTSWRDQLIGAVSSFTSNITQNLGGHLWTSLRSFADGLIAAVITLVMTFLMLTEGPRLWSTFWRRFNSVRHSKIQRILERMRHTVVQFMTGQIIIGLVDMVLVTISLLVFCLIFRLPLSLALPLGVASGIFNMIPIGGAVLSFAVVGFILLLVSPPAAAAFLVYYIIYQQLENNILIPKIQSRSSNLPILVVFVAIAIGLYSGGILGMLLAVPIAGCLKILLEEFLLTRSQKTPEVKVA